jgi:hypothetical protein
MRGKPAEIATAVSWQRERLGRGEFNDNNRGAAAVVIRIYVDLWRSVARHCSVVIRRTIALESQGIQAVNGVIKHIGKSAPRLGIIS